MNVGLSWETFIKCAKQIELKSIELGDDWVLIGCNEIPSKAYLQYRRLQKEENTILKWEYHVCYNLSYGMPTLYFNVWNKNGNLLSLHDIWNFCHSHFKSPSSDEMYSVITQQEHPVLLRPYFTIHPCKTHEFLTDCTENLNILVKYITSVGPLVNLELCNSYGKL